MPTLAEVTERFDVRVLDHLLMTAEVPVVTKLACQGDLLIQAHRPGKGSGTPIPSEGIAVVRGEAGGNTHSLHGDGTWRPGADMILGTVSVPEAGCAYLLHPEHGALGIGPGNYLIRRQQEQGDIIRVVAD
jgi:hypothetical protein